MKNNTSQASITTPWYRIPMVWFVIALPLSVVVASLVTVTIAHQNAPNIISTQVSDTSTGK